MITEATTMMIQLRGSGQVTIDWGDGKPVETITLTSTVKDYKRADLPSGSKNILLKGEGITFLGCADNSLTSLDVSKFPKLTDLNCIKNNLTTIDVSKNPALTVLACNWNELTSLDVSNNHELYNFQCVNNQLTEEALKTLFNKLPNRTGLKTKGYIFCSGNPGYVAAETAIKNIATQKNWELQQ